MTINTQTSDCIATCADGRTRDIAVGVLDAAIRDIARTTRK